MPLDSSTWPSLRHKFSVIQLELIFSSPDPDSSWAPPLRPWLLRSLHLPGQELYVSQASPFPAPPSGSMKLQGLSPCLGLTWSVTYPSPCPRGERCHALPWADKETEAQRGEGASQGCTRTKPSFRPAGQAFPFVPGDAPPRPRSSEAPSVCSGKMCGTGSWPPGARGPRPRPRCRREVLLGEGERAKSGERMDGETSKGRKTDY